FPFRSLQPLVSGSKTVAYAVATEAGYVCKISDDLTTDRYNCFDFGAPRAYGVQFLPNGQYGWVVEGKGSLHYTSDGGINWSMVSQPSSDDLHGVFFINENRGWVTGSNGVIFTTNDGGANWQKETSGTTSQINSINF